MNSNAFQNANDCLPPPTRLRVRTLLLAAACTIGGMAWCLFYLASDGFTRGTQADLTATDKLTLDEMQNTGIVVRDAALPCTMRPHVVVQVNWDSQRGDYCVSKLGLRNVPFESVLPFISRFAGLKEINAPYLPKAELVKISRVVPSIHLSEIAER